MAELQGSLSDDETKVTSTVRRRISANERDTSNSTESLLCGTDQDKQSGKDDGSKDTNNDIAEGKDPNDNPVTTSNNVIPDSPRKRSVPYLDFPFMTGKVTNSILCFCNSGSHGLREGISFEDCNFKFHPDCPIKLNQLGIIAYD